MGGSGDAAKKTAEQVVMERRQRNELNEEIAASERRLKATARGKLGKRSLLGQPMQPVAAPTGPTITKGYQMSEGNLVKTPGGVRGIFSRFLNTDLGASAMGKGPKAGSLIGKATGKGVRTGRMDK